MALTSVAPDLKTTSSSVRTPATAFLLNEPISKTSSLPSQATGRRIVDLKDIKAIIDLMKKNSIAEFELEKEGFKIRLKRGGMQVSAV